MTTVVKVKENNILGRCLGSMGLKAINDVGAGGFLVLQNQQLIVRTQTFTQKFIEKGCIINAAVQVIDWHWIIVDSNE